MEPNYYPEIQHPDSLHYRLDTKEIIEQSIDTFRGGVKGIDEKGKKTYNTEHRLMNDLGISKAKMMLESGVNKIVHLTKFKDEERVFRQVKSMTKTWIYEVVLNMKKWAPTAYFNSNGKLVNPSGDKIRNKHLVIAVVENGLLQSMLRGTAGFEAELTGKQMQVVESRDYSTHNREENHQPMGGFFGGR
jgi:hypothetical protein